MSITQLILLINMNEYVCVGETVIVFKLRIVSFPSLNSRI